MNKIWYFTTAQDANSFEKELANFAEPPNLSNQNFHNKLIRCLSLTHNVNVFSIRPINNGYKFETINESKQTENNIDWTYPQIDKSKLKRYFSISKKFKMILSQISHDDYIFVDTLNINLLKLARRASKKTGAKIICVCTDNPNNISFVKNSYPNKVLRLSKNCFGYLCLTEKLNALFNTNNAKSLIFDGLTEDIQMDVPLVKDPYIYFGGSLMEKYGIFNLIKAFELLKLSNVKLVISGHHIPNDLDALIKNNQNIIFMGPVNYVKNINLEHHSLCAVNPRSIDPSIDEYSIPSKVLEYITSGTITISTMSALLYKKYSESIIWAKANTPEELLLSIKKAISLTPSERNALIANAKKDVLSRTSLQVINNKIDNLFF